MGTTFAESVGNSLPFQTHTLLGIQMIPNMENVCLKSGVGMGWEGGVESTENWGSKTCEQDLIIL